LTDSNVLVSNQTTFLKNVNDDPDTLVSLFNSLICHGVTPYYLFQCRPVNKVKDFYQIPIAEGIKIVENARKRLNGFAKRFKFVMSHKTGKIEIIGIHDDTILLQYHQAAESSDTGKILFRKINPAAAWLDDF
jgi:lysine 2,3-aminomutase